MGRKVDARILALEKDIDSLRKLVHIQIEDFGRFVEASKKDWRDLRDFLTQMIEGE